MADEPGAATSKAGKARTIPVLIVVLLMAGEGAAVFFIVKALNSGAVPAVASAGAEGDENAGADGSSGGVGPLAELELADCKPSNKMSGKFVTFQIRVSALVPAARLEWAEEVAEAKEARIRDRINFVIRSAELKHFNEPGLETIKRRLRHELDRIFEDDTVIQEVLIPEMLQSNPGV